MTVSVPVCASWDLSLGVMSHTYWSTNAPPAPDTYLPSCEMLVPMRWTGVHLGVGSMSRSVVVSDTPDWVGSESTGEWVVLEDHDIGPLILDVSIPANNVWMPITWLLSGRVVMWSASTVEFEGTPVGAAVAPPDSFLPMITCGDPIPMPTAVPIWMQYRHQTYVGLTLADLLMGLAKVVVSVAIEAVFAKSDFKAIKRASAGSKLGRQSGKKALGEAGEEAVKEAGDDAVSKLGREASDEAKDAAREQAEKKARRKAEKQAKLETRQEIAAENAASEARKKSMKEANAAGEKRRKDALEHSRREAAEAIRKEEREAKGLRYAPMAGGLLDDYVKRAVKDEAGEKARAEAAEEAARQARKEAFDAAQEEAREKARKEIANKSNNIRGETYALKAGKTYGKEFAKNIGANFAHNAANFVIEAITASATGDDWADEQIYVTLNLGPVGNYGFVVTPHKLQDGYTKGDFDWVPGWGTEATEKEKDKKKDQE